MTIYVVWYRAVEREVVGYSETNRIYGVYDSVQKARACMKELEKKFNFYVDFDSYEVE